MIEILDKFTTHFKSALLAAVNFAFSNNQILVNPEHILYGLLVQKGSVGCEILKKINLNSEKIKLSLIKENFYPLKNSLIKEPKLSQETKQLIYKAIVMADLYEHNYVGTEHLLAALLELNNPVVNKIISSKKDSSKFLKTQVLAVLKNTSKFADLTETFSALKEQQLTEKNFDSAKSKTPALDTFTINLTDPRIQKNIDPVIAREKEIERLIQILCRRAKNNPLLLGDPGVGKTAIVEGLAKKIVNEEVPDILLNKKILTLDMGLIIAGTMYRGEFESRLRYVLDEIKQDPNIILFIDEVHNIIGTGSTSGTLDMANLLKPALARGEIKCIGATTYEDYRKFIQKDPALERRFQPVKIIEPTALETIEILKGVKENYENYHQVLIADEAIDAAVYLSERYISDKFLPDKAIDLIDEAASRLKVKDQGNVLIREISRFSKKLEEIKYQKQKAVFDEDFKKALEYKKDEAKILSELVKLEKENSRAEKRILGQVTKADIEEVVSKITGIPLENLAEEEKHRLLNLEDILNQKIIGQGEAVKLIAEVIRRSKTGIASPDRPIGSFMFLGPSGSGKTHTAKILAQTIFENKDALIRVDMSEYAEKFNISKLIGAPAGYVGYQESGTLTESVKRKPYSIILFDEIEKAHPDVFNLLLQILEDGILTDAAGKTVNFKNTIIIMTSNVGLKDFNKSAYIGFSSAKGKGVISEFQEVKEKLLSDLSNYFRPEFLNRIDKIIVFNPLSKKDLEVIALLQAKELESRLMKQGIKIFFSPKAIEQVIKRNVDFNLGARSIKKNLQELIENPLSEFLLNENLKSKELIKIGLKNNKIIFEN